MGIVSAPVGWAVTDYLERDNDFCIACHLTEEVPLHDAIRLDFDAQAPASLAGLHGVAGVEGRAHAAFRCIDCHGGASFVGRARVKALAAKDAFWYAMGHFEEPTEMRWPLWDEDCAKCHTSFDQKRSKPWQRARFHELGVHNVSLGVGCVECHLSHEPGGNPDGYFLHAKPVRAQCARCHAEYEEKKS